MLLRYRSIGIYFATHAGESQCRWAIRRFDLHLLGNDGLLFLSRNHSLESGCRLRFDYLRGFIGDLEEVISTLSQKPECPEG